MSKALIEALRAVCIASDADPDTTKRVIQAARGNVQKPDGLLTTKAAAGVLECHPKSVWRYANRGVLNPVRRSARCVRWRKSEVERLAFEGVE